MVCLGGGGGGNSYISFVVPIPTVREGGGVMEGAAKEAEVAHTYIIMSR